MKDKTTVFNNISPAKSPFDYPPKGQYCFGDVLWPVLPAERDQYSNILKRIFETIEQASLQSSRFLAIRYDFHLKEYSSDNKAISRFHSLVFPCLCKKYPRSFISFFWVREQAESDAQHYHYLLMLNGNVVKHSKRVNQIVMACWEQANRGTCWVPDNCYYLVNDINSHRDLLMRTSYLGKKRTKETIGKGIKRFGYGLRKPKPTKRKTISKKRIATVPVVPEENNVNQLDGMNRFPGYLDAYFTGDASLPIYHQPPAHSELYDHTKWWNPLSPLWEGHSRNYLAEAIITGISLSQYAYKYHLSASRVYVNFKRVGGQSLKVIHWAWHRSRFYQSNSTLDNYLKNNRLHQKTAKKQLQRKPMSEFWQNHFDNYYKHFLPYGCKVTEYCRKYNLNASTARRYLVAFPFIGLIDPFVLRRWL